MLAELSQTCLQSGSSMLQSVLGDFFQTSHLSSIMLNIVRFARAGQGFKALYMLRTYGNVRLPYKLVLDCSCVDLKLLYCTA